MRYKSQICIQNLIRLILFSGGVNLGISDDRLCLENKPKRWREERYQMRNEHISFYCRRHIRKFNIHMQIKCLCSTDSSYGLGPDAVHFATAEISAHVVHAYEMWDLPKVRRNISHYFLASLLPLQNIVQVVDNWIWLTPGLQYFLVAAVQWHLTKIRWKWTAFPTEIIVTLRKAQQPVFFSCFCLPLRNVGLTSINKLQDVHSNILLVLWSTLQSKLFFFSGLRVGRKNYVFRPWTRSSIGLVHHINEKKKKWNNRTNKEKETESIVF